MTDEFKPLRDALDAATPAPDAARRAANLRAAQENFDALQGSRIPARHTPDRRPLVGRLTSGAANMIRSLTSRGGLAATTALVAVGLFVITPQGRSLFTPPGPVVQRNEAAPVATPAPATQADRARSNAPGDTDSIAPEQEAPV
ncbi:MAG: VWA domain-containing protein, partial [Paracoccaceae bacterium]